MLILHKIIFVNKKFVKKKLWPARRNFSLPFCSLRIFGTIPDSHVFSAYCPACYISKA